MNLFYNYVLFIKIKTPAYFKHLTRGTKNTLTLNTVYTKFIKFEISVHVYTLNLILEWYRV